MTNAVNTSDDTRNMGIAKIMVRYEHFISY